MDGWVTIGTKLDTKQLERDLNNAQKKLAQYEKEAEKLTEAKGKAELDLQDYEQAKRSIEEFTNQTLKCAQTTEEVNKVLEDEKGQLNDLNSKYAQQLSAVENINKKLQQNAINQSTVSRQVEDLSSKLGQSQIYDGINNGVSKISQSMSGIIKKTTRWVFAVFSVRSAYSLITRSMSILSEYNDELANKIQGIRFVLASALEPVINYILGVVQKIVAYIAYILKAWFGIDILSKSTAKSMKAGASSAEKMRKSLAGFDEMNVLGDNVSASGGGASGGGGFDLGDFANIEKPGWLKWIAENKDLILGILGAIATAIAAIKIADFLGHFQTASGAFSAFKAGTAIAIAGLALFAGEVINLITNWDDLSESERLTAEALGILGAAFVGLGTAMATGASAMGIAIGGIVGALIGLISMIGISIWKHEEERAAIKSVEDQENSLRDARSKQRDAYDEYIRAVDREIEAKKNLSQVEGETKISGAELHKEVENGSLSYKDMNEAQKKVYKAYLESIDATADLADIEKKLAEQNENVKYSEFKKQIAADKTGKTFNDVKKTVIKAWEDQEISTKHARDLMERMMADMDYDATKTFQDDIPLAIRYSMDPSRYKSTWQNFKDSFLRSFDDMEVVMRYKVEGKWVYEKTTMGKMATGGIIPPAGKPLKLASGAVINRPGAGVPVRRNVYAGEAGAEGIIPLTDSQRMELLGEAIGKYININATVPVYVGNRQIAREIKRINAEDDFAYNR